MDQAEAPDDSRPPITPRLPLSPRELDVLGLLARGLTDKEAALSLDISHGTVRVYRDRVENKLGVKGSVLCAIVAWRRGDLDLDAIADEVERRAAENTVRLT